MGGRGSGEVELVRSDAARGKACDLERGAETRGTCHFSPFHTVHFCSDLECSLPPTPFSISQSPSGSLDQGNSGSHIWVQVERREENSYTT